MKYLFFTDGSKNSFEALEAALRLVKNGCVIDIFNLQEEKSFLKKLYNDEDDCIDFEKIVKKSQKIIESHAHFLGEAFRQKGSIDDVFHHFEKHFYNMIILGSHNYKGLKNQFFSFARKVLGHATCPIFIFRGKLKKLREGKKNKILLCIDSSFQTLNAVISFIKNFEGDNDIVLATVSGDFFQHPLEISLSGGYVEEILQKEAVVAKKNLDEIQELLCHNGINIKSKIHLRGNPSDEILNFVKQDFNLLVLGAHSREGLADYLLGSVSKNILDYSSFPMLIVPTKKS